MRQYINLVKDIIKNGQARCDRTGIGTKSIFGTQLRFNLEDGFPAVTTKKLAWKAVVSELLWFLEGSTNEHRLAEIKNSNTSYSNLTDAQKRTIWTDNFENQGKSLGYKDGELGPVYGKQWRKWKGLRALHDNTSGCYSMVEIDQIQNVIDSIQNDPFSRRHIVNTWNVADIPDMALPPCHLLFQFYVEPDLNGKPEKLSLMWTQRSIDVGLGLPFNVASYALLLSIIAKICHLKPHNLIFSGGDAHVYLDHIDALEKQIQNEPLQLPQLQLPEFENLDELLKYTVDDFKLINYNHHEIIKMKMAV